MTILTNKCWHSFPLLAYIVTTICSHSKSGYSQWCESWLSSEYGSCDRTIQKFLLVTTADIVPETNLIVSDISWMSSIGRWVPFQCHSRFVRVYGCFQVFNWVRCESCSILLKITWRDKEGHYFSLSPNLHNSIRCMQLSLLLLVVWCSTCIVHV